MLRNCQERRRVSQQVLCDHTLCVAHNCRESLTMNVLAVKEMIKLCRKMKKLLVRTERMCYVVVWCMIRDDHIETLHVLELTVAPFQALNPCS